MQGKGKENSQNHEGKSQAKTKQSGESPCRSEQKDGEPWDVSN